jgi:hypothetical protein
MSAQSQNGINTSPTQLHKGPQTDADQTKNVYTRYTSDLGAVFDHKTTNRSQTNANMQPTVTRKRQTKRTQIRRITITLVIRLIWVRVWSQDDQRIKKNQQMLPERQYDNNKTDPVQTCSETYTLSKYICWIVLWIFCTLICFSIFNVDRAVESWKRANQEFWSKFVVCSFSWLLLQRKQ